ncbi:MAG: hypothetical protein QOH06_5706 [Acidobacteriota bacterium]|jgi:hypothetical protein|nr:hypothetical protein [Acidobacteriota bacterium]
MGGCLSLFLAPVGFFVSYPQLALVPAACFLLYFAARRRAAGKLDLSSFVRWSLAAGLVWLAYTLYEFRMQTWSRSVAGAPIRVDLVLAAPVLYLASLAAVWSGVRFERALRGGHVPSKTERLAGVENRRLVLGAAVALGVLSILDCLFWSMSGDKAGLESRAAPFVINLGLAFFLGRGYLWARWLVAARCALGVIFQLFAWSSLASVADRFFAMRLWNLASAAVYAAICVLVLLSLRPHKGPGT